MDTWINPEPRGGAPCSVQTIRAALFDVDGTLYHQIPLRLLMGWELCRLPLERRSLRAARQTWRTIAAFRRVREDLRRRGAAGASLERLQYQLTGERSGTPLDLVESTVVEWIHSRPLRHLRRCRRAGLESLLSFLEQRGIRLGAFSDYPVREKLEALGIAPRFSVMLCATDAEINAFKPDPRGFRRACELWGLTPQEVLYVGDRLDVDAGGAAAAGMPCAVLAARGGARSTPGGTFRIRSLHSLQRLLEQRWSPRD